MSIPLFQNQIGGSPKFGGLVVAKVLRPALHLIFPFFTPSSKLSVNAGEDSPPDQQINGFCCCCCFCCCSSLCFAGTDEDAGVKQVRAPASLSLEAGARISRRRLPVAQVWREDRQGLQLSSQLLQVQPPRY